MKRQWLTRVDFSGPGRLALSDDESSLIAKPTFGAHSALAGSTRAGPQATRPHLTMDADRSAFFIALVAVDVLVGLADAVSGPYTVLFLVDQAGLSPLP